MLIGCASYLFLADWLVQLSAIGHRGTGQSELVGRSGWWELCRRAWRGAERVTYLVKKLLYWGSVRARRRQRRTARQIANGGGANGNRREIKSLSIEAKIRDETELKGKKEKK